MTVPDTIYVCPECGVYSNYSGQCMEHLWGESDAVPKLVPYERMTDLDPAGAELRDLRKIGDILQSAADRLADHVERGDKPPYEVAMACHEARDMVAAWTEIRKSA